jgi:hypothetical protein
VADPEAVLQGAAAVVENPDNRFSAIVEVELDQDADVIVRYGELALDHATPARRVPGATVTRIPILGLHADRTYQVQVTASVGESAWEDRVRSYTTDPLPAGWPVCTPTFTAPESEYSVDEVVCSNSRYGSSHVYSCWDRWGQPVFALQNDADDSLFSMSPLPEGGWASTSYNHSSLQYFDEFGAQTERFTIGWFRNTRFQHDWVDVHETTPIVEGPWAGAVVFATASYETFDDGSYKLGNGLIVYDRASDEVLYDFSLHGELGDQVSISPVMPYDRTGWGDYTEDWNHLNSILHGFDEAGQEYFLLSLKAQNWVLKLHPDTDEVVWRLGAGGEFTLVDDLEAAEPVALDVLEWQSHQHGMFDLGERGNRLLMFDNGYPREDENGSRWDLVYSRVVEYTLDPDTMRAELSFEWGPTDSADSDWFFSSSRSNAELLPGEERLIFLSGEQMRMREVAYPDGGERWQLDCPYDDEGMYRVHWFPDLYQTDWTFR